MKKKIVLAGGTGLINTYFREKQKPGLSLQDIIGSRG